MYTLVGRMSGEPPGMAWSVPAMPIGTIGTPDRVATNAGPACISSASTTGPNRRVPSGNMTIGSPRSSTSWQARSAARSAVPRSTGNPPTIVRKRPPRRDFHSDSLPRNRNRRAVTIPPTGVSRYDRWTGERMYGSSRGRCSLPTTRNRNQALENSHSSDQKNR